MKHNSSTYILTFEWHSLCRDLFRSSWIMVLTGVIAFVGIYIAQCSIYTPAYTSTATLAVRIKSGTASAIDSLAVSADTAGIYAAVFQSTSMQALAAEHLDMDVFPGDVTAAAVSGLNLMMLSVTADDPELAYDLINSILAVYPQISDAIFSNAVIQVMEAPKVPEAPSDQLSVKRCAVWVLLAMMVQVCTVILLSLLRETVKHERAFAQMVKSSLLGTITHERPHLPLKKRLLRQKRVLWIDSAFASLRFVEDYQKLATRLEHLKRKQNAEVFAVTSAAEREGRSTVTVNLALALSARGYRVAVIDLDLRKPSLCQMMGSRADVQQEFSDVLCGQIPVQDAVFQQYRPGLLFALSKRSRRDTADWLGTDRTKQILSGIRANTDFVLIDTPPMSASADAAAVVRMADRTILTVRTDRTAAVDLNDTIAALSAIGGDLAGCVLNDVYRPFTLFGQMGVEEDGAYYGSYFARKRYGQNGRLDR